MGDSTPPTALTTIRLHLRKPDEGEAAEERPSQQETPIATATTTTEGEKRRNEQEARGKEEREREDLAERYTATGKHSQHVVQYTQIDIVEEDGSQQPTQLVEKRHRGGMRKESRRGKKKAKEEKKWTECWKKKDK